MAGRRLGIVARSRKAAPTLAVLAGGSPRKRNKFGVAPRYERTWNGILFASAGELARHKQLIEAEQAGTISNLVRQVPLVLVRGQTGRSLLKWIVDWRYTENERVVVEDFTGVMTSLKRSNMRICADLYPDLVIRISTTEGYGRNKRTVLTDCIKGRLPVKRKRMNLTSV